MGGHSWSAGPVPIYGFGLGLGLIYIFGTWLSRPAARRLGIDTASWWRLTTGLVIVAVVGARLSAAAFDWSQYATAPWTIWRPPLDKLHYYGGVSGAAAYAAFVAYRRQVNFWRLLDVWAVAWAIGLVIAAVLWGAPPGTSTMTGWIVVPLNAVYLTGAFFLLWYVWTGMRGDFSAKPAGQSVSLAVGIDGMLRFLTGFIAAVALQTPFRAVWALHGMRIGIGVLGLLLFFRLRRAVAWEKSTLDPFYRPLSRWVGWLVVYGFLFAVMIAAHR